jgi:hypothetical protein
VAKNYQATSQEIDAAVSGCSVPCKEAEEEFCLEVFGGKKKQLMGVS